MSKKVSALEVIKEASPKRVKHKTDKNLPNPMKNACTQKMTKNNQRQIQIGASKGQNSNRDNSSSHEKAVYQTNPWPQKQLQDYSQKKSKARKDAEESQNNQGSKIEEELLRFLRENANLKKRIQQFAYENIEVRDQNQYLRDQLDALMRQFRNCFAKNGDEHRQGWSNTGGMRKMRSSGNIFENDRKYSRIISETPSSNNAYHHHPRQENKKIILHYLHWCQCLENQIKLLYTIKQNLEKSLNHSESQIQQLQMQNREIIDLNTSLRETIAEREYQNLELSEKLEEFSETIERAHEEIVSAKEDNRKLESEHEVVHKKFHVEIERMREKTERYRLKAEQYRCERDQLALEIQKAKAEVGGLTNKQPFTSTRAISTKNH